MSTAPQVLLFDGDLSDADLPAAFAALDAEPATRLRPDLLEFMSDLLTVKGVDEVEAVGGRALLIIAPDEHITRVAEYVLHYRPRQTTLVEPLTYSILRHWTELDVFGQGAEDDPEAEAAARAKLDGIIAALQPALEPMVGMPSIHLASHGNDALVALWRYHDDAHVLVVECKVDVRGAEVSLTAAVTSLDSIEQWNKEEPTEAVGLDSADLIEVEAMDDAELWRVTVDSPTMDRVLAAAYDDLGEWITRSLALS